MSSLLPSHQPQPLLQHPKETLEICTETGACFHPVPPSHSCPVSTWTLIQGKLGLGPLCRTGITGCYKATCRTKSHCHSSPAGTGTGVRDRRTAGAAGPESPYCHLIITCPTPPGPGRLKGPAAALDSLARPHGSGAVLGCRRIPLAARERDSSDRGS